MTAGRTTTKVHPFGNVTLIVETTSAHADAANVWHPTQRQVFRKPDGGCRLLIGTVECSEAGRSGASMPRWSFEPSDWCPFGRPIRLGHTTLRALLTEIAGRHADV